VPYLGRKQRELQRRVDLILQVGRELLLDSGYRGLTMTRIAELTEYSKGTIYQHFSCKEEIVQKLAAKSTEKLVELLLRVQSYQGSALLKLGLVAEAMFLFYRLYPVEFSLLSTIRSKAVRERISAKHYAELESRVQAAMGIVKEIISEGVKNDELELDKTLIPEELAAGVWFMLYGALNLHEGKSQEDDEIDKYFQLTRKNFQYYVACWPWASANDERAGVEELRRCVSAAKNELFTDEVAGLGKQVVKPNLCT